MSRILILTTLAVQLIFSVSSADSIVARCSDVFTVSRQEIVYPNHDIESIFLPLRPDLEINYQFYKENHPNRKNSYALDRQEMLKKAIPQIVEEFKKDVELRHLSQYQLTKAALRVLKWRIRFSAVTGFDEPSVDFRPAFEMERYRLHLKVKGIDPDAKPPSFKSLLKQFGYTSLAHGTSFQGLIKILRSGQLKPRQEGGQNAVYDRGSQQFVYLEALPKFLEKFYYKNIGYEEWARGQRQLGRIPDEQFDIMNKEPEYAENMALAEWQSRTPIYFEIDTSVLDQLRWSHFNFHWRFGEKKEPHYIEPSNLLAGFFNMVKENQKNSDDLLLTNSRNEFLFLESIDIRKYVKAIYIEPALREKAIAKLKELGIPEDLLKLIRDISGS